MFGFLKEKLSKAVKSISEKIEKNEEQTKKIEEKIEHVEQKSVEQAIEEVKPVAEEIPEIKKEIEEVIEEIKENPEEKKSLFKKLKEKIVKTVAEKKLGDQDLDPILSDFENGLIEADVAVEVVEKIKSDLKKRLVGKEIKRGEEKKIVVDSLKKSLLEILDVPEIDLEKMKKDSPLLVLFLGFNGSGKTTSLAKVGKLLKEKNSSCVFAAADTFRAASEEQLEEHAKKIGVKVIKHKHGADPAAVIFDAVEHAKAGGIDFVLADTAGRAHTNANLMDQMKKIIRVNNPDLKILVIDSLTGNDAVLQARMYGELGVDAVIFTKVDVNEKGGAILSVTHELKKPILFLGFGQGHKDFIRFNAQDFVDKIVGD